jgi:predicted Zn-dependent protease
MPNKKRKTPEISFVSGFSKPTEQQNQEAVGRFPWDKHADESGAKIREGILIKRGGASSVKSVRDIDIPAYYRNSIWGKRCEWPALPNPFDEGSWLATVCEEGQTVDDYIASTTLRSGAFRPSTNSDNPNIYIVPIIAHGDDEVSWPNTAPPLEAISEWVSAFFDRKCIVLDFVSLKPASGCVMWCVPGEREKPLKGRISATRPGRFQTHVDDLVTALRNIKIKGTLNGSTLDKPFAVVGVTSTDIFSCDDDLFIAGWASDTGATVLSYARYHPRMKMCSFRWDDYAYIGKSSDYSYYEDNKPRPKVSNELVPFKDMDKLSQCEYIRRAGKLIVHELCHVYKIAHCIHHHCLMNGTGVQVYTSFISI